MAPGYALKLEAYALLALILPLPGEGSERVAALGDKGEQAQYHSR